MRRIGSRVVTVLAVLAGTLPAGCATAEPPPAAAESATTRQLRDYLDGEVRAQRFRGAVEVRLGDQVLLSRGFGEADVDSGVANGPYTRFRIASVTKQFTALAVLVLQERGELRVTDPVCTHLPDCPAAWRAITIDQLLTHTSGLFDYTDIDPAVVRGDGEPTPEELTRLFADRPLRFAPGTGRAYTNSGYVLLGRVVEERSGRPWGEFLRTEILDPLGMSGTGYAPGRGTPRGYATGYHRWALPALTLDDSVFYAAAGLYSTVRDLARWNKFLINGDPAVATPGTLAELLRARVETSPTEQYGYGIQTRGSARELAYFHAGRVAGFASYDEVQPATGVSVTVLANLDTADAVRIGRHLASVARR